MYRVRIDKSELLKNRVDELRPIEYSFFAINYFGSRLVERLPQFAISVLDIPSVTDEVVRISIKSLKRDLGIQ
jgi:hypothetical protein